MVDEKEDNVSALPSQETNMTPSSHPKDNIKISSSKENTPPKETALPSPTISSVFTSPSIVNVSMSEATEMVSPPVQTSKKIYLTRHANSQSNKMQSLWDEQKYLESTQKLFGHVMWRPVDVNLTNTGRRQIKAMSTHSKGFLKEHDIQAIYHSDYRRAIQTALGLFKDEADSLGIPFIQSELIREIGYGERVIYSNFIRRTDALSQWLESLPYDNILVVGHGMLFQELTDSRKYFPNCVTWRFDVTGGKWSNRTCMLGPDLCEEISEKPRHISEISNGTKDKSPENNGCEEKRAEISEKDDDLSLIDDHEKHSKIKENDNDLSLDDRDVDRDDK